MIEPEDFQSPEGFDDAQITRLRDAAREFAATMADNFQDEGFTTRQGASMAAHIMLDAAWAVAVCGTLAEGVEPSHERFIEAARRAIDRLDLEATKAKFMEHKAKFMEQMQEAGDA